MLSVLQVIFVGVIHYCNHSIHVCFNTWSLGGRNGCGIHPEQCITIRLQSIDIPPRRHICTCTMLRWTHDERVQQNHTKYLILSVEFLATSPCFAPSWPPKAAGNFVLFFGQFSKANGPKSGILVELATLPPCFGPLGNKGALIFGYKYSNAFFIIYQKVFFWGAEVPNIIIVGLTGVRDRVCQKLFLSVYWVCKCRKVTTQHLQTRLLDPDTIPQSVSLHSTMDFCPPPKSHESRVFGRQ